MWDDLVSFRDRTTSVLGNLWAGWRERRGAMAELASCPQDEVNRMASELGLSFGELRDLVAQGPSAADLLTKRLRALDIDLADPVLLEIKKDLQRCCSFCDSKRQCARDLEADPLSPAWTAYCPNEAALSALVALASPANVPEGLPR
jgi:hypothetical protein